MKALISGIAVQELLSATDCDSFRVGEFASIATGNIMNHNVGLHGVEYVLDRDTIGDVRGVIVDVGVVVMLLWISGHNYHLEA
jgi:hypothetical protein